MIKSLNTAFFGGMQETPCILINVTFQKPATRIIVSQTQQTKHVWVEQSQMPGNAYVITSCYARNEIHMDGSTVHTTQYHKQDLAMLVCVAPMAKLQQADSTCTKSWASKWTLTLPLTKQSEAVTLAPERKWKGGKALRCLKARILLEWAYKQNKRKKRFSRHARAHACVWV